MSDKNQKLVLAILDFLNTSIDDGTVKADDKEGLEVAVQCIGEAFGVDPNDAAQRERLSIKPATLVGLFDLFSKTSEKVRGNAAASAQASTSAAAASSSTPKPPAGPTGADKKAADTFKAQGNAHMSAKKYDDAIEAYTKATELDPTNPVYFSNRAAAYSSVDDQDSAIADAQKAAELDPSFVKAYSRLGHAYYSKEDYTSAIQAFEDGLRIDPNNANLKLNLENAKARLPAVERTTAPSAGGAGLGGLGGGGMPDLSSLAGMFGGGAGGGGVPNIAAMMQNPQLMAMAQSMMANGGLERLMSNPALRDMANNMSAGNPPSVADIMNNPDLANLASNFMGGAGAPGAPPP